MQTLPKNLTNHPFFRNIKSEMKSEQLEYKKKIDNYSNLSKTEKNAVFFELLDLGFHWPNPLRQEGFWCEKEEENDLFKEYPYPEENTIDPQEIANFLSKLEKIEKKAATFSYMGFSKCRCCGKINGTKTYYTDLFAWPEGYKHYIKEHGVQPTAAFVLHIRGLIN